MAFEPKVWKNLPDITTPLSATALTNMETRLSNYTDGIAYDLGQNIGSAEIRVTNAFQHADEDVAAQATSEIATAQQNAFDYTDSQIDAIAFTRSMTFQAPGAVTSSTFILPQYIAVEAGTTVSLVGIYGHMYNMGSGSSVTFDLHIGGTNRTGNGYASGNRYSQGLVVVSQGGMLGGTPAYNALNWSFEHNQWIGIQCTATSGSPTNMILSLVLEQSMST